MSSPTSAISDFRSSDLYQVVCQAASDGDVMFLAECVKRKYDFPAEMGGQPGPLALAAAMGHAEAVSLMIRQDNVNVVDNMGCTPLMHAVRNGHHAAEAVLRRQGSLLLVAIDTLPVSDCYLWLEQVGRGKFGVVFRAERRGDGSDVAIKVIAKRNISRFETLRREIDILRRVRHPNVVELYDVFEDEKHVYLVMEYLAGGELFERISKDYPKGYREDAARRIFEKLLRAVAFLHDNNIIHRDLKPENLVFDKPGGRCNLKITDFGLARIMSHESFVCTQCGSPQYMAPEVIKGESYAYAADMWSLGVVLYVLLSGLVPFSGQTEMHMQARALKGRFSFPSPAFDRVSPAAKDLLKKLIVLDSSDRLTARQALGHPWFRTECLGRLVNVAENMRGMSLVRNIQERFDRPALLMAISQRNLIGDGDLDNPPLLTSPPAPPVGSPTGESPTVQALFSRSSPHHGVNDPASDSKYREASIDARGMIMNDMERVDRPPPISIPSSGLPGLPSTEAGVCVVSDMDTDEESFGVWMPTPHTGSTPSSRKAGELPALRGSVVYRCDPADAAAPPITSPPSSVGPLARLMPLTGSPLSNRTQAQRFLAPVPSPRQRGHGEWRCPLPAPKRASNVDACASTPTGSSPRLPGLLRDLDRAYPRVAGSSPPKLDPVRAPGPGQGFEGGGRSPLMSGDSPGGPPGSSPGRCS